MHSVKIPRVPPTVRKSVRFPVDVIEQVESAYTFTAFVVEAVKMMLENLEEDEQPSLYFQ